MGRGTQTTSPSGAFRGARWGGVGGGLRQERGRAGPRAGAGKTGRTRSELLSPGTDGDPGRRRGGFGDVNVRRDALRSALPPKVDIRAGHNSLVCRHHLGPDLDSAILDTPFRNTTIWLCWFTTEKGGRASLQQAEVLGYPRPQIVFLKLFLVTADKYFMVGHKVNYVFTDQPADILNILLQEGWQVVDLKVCNYPCCQGMSMHRMEMISNFCEQCFLHEVDYLVCLDVDLKLSDHMGVEILFSFTGTLGPGVYVANHQAFTHECHLLSQAHIPRDEGDSYSAGGFFGGSVLEVHRLTKSCHQAIMVDHANHIEAEWHDESHLNKHLLYPKPTKVLSPEYLWDERMLCRPPFLRKRWYMAVPKNHQALWNP
ncbi:LOW QUALITY PROTEIN: histo-blood group ABO system transferase-like [Dugong dugon]